MPGWTWGMFADARRQHLDLLWQLARRHGGLPEFVPKTVVRGQRIGVAVARWRIAYRKGTLPQTMIAQLEAIPGWSWGENVDERHRRKLAVLKRFLENHDLGEVYAARPVEGVNLRNWVTALRVGYREGRTQPLWLIRELEKLPEWSWCPREDAPIKRRSPKYRQLR